MSAGQVFDLQTGSKATIRVYKTAWKRFERYCEVNTLSSLPASSSTLEAFLNDVSATAKSTSTIDVYIAAIERCHALNGIRLPEGDLKYLRRKFRDKMPENRRKSPILPSKHLAKIFESLGDDIVSIRDRAILLLGFGSGLQRSEIVDLDLEQIDFRLDSVRVFPSGRQALAIDVADHTDSRLCLRTALQAWIQAAPPGTYFENGTERTPIFRGIDRFGRPRRQRMSGETVRLVAQVRAREAKIPSKEIGDNMLRMGRCIDLDDVAGRLPKLSRSIIEKDPKKPLFHDVAAQKLQKRDFDDSELRQAMLDADRVSARVAAKIAPAKPSKDEGGRK